MSNALGELFGSIADAIREKTGDTAKMKPVDFPEKITAIEASGGSSADVRYVTFMSENGSQEYGRIPVAVGYDCPNPKFAVTKESTAQYNYTLAGWATTPNGGLDSNALKAVNEDRILYANFASVLRSYTIRFMDGDTVLNFFTMTYGSTPSVAEPKKSGYSFDGWNPAISAVTGDADYQAQWVEAITFSGGTWADIARVCEAGEASKYFSVGDTRTITVKWIDNTTTDIDIEIIDINHDDLANGNGKAGITIGTAVAINNYHFAGKSGTEMKTGWPNSNIRSPLASTGFANLPSDMTRYIKDVTKLSKASSSDTSVVSSVDKLFVPSDTEFVGGSGGYGTQYAHYTNSNNRRKYLAQIGGVDLSKYCNHYTRTPQSYGSWLGMIGTDGSYKTNATENNNAVVCWCI